MFVKIVINPPHVLLVGTDPNGMGGVASVFRAYRAGGLFERWPVDHLVTHVDGGKIRKIWVLLRSLALFTCWMLRGKGRILHIHTSSRASFYRKCIFVWMGRLWRRRVLLHLHGGEFMLFYQQEIGPLRKWLVRATFAAAHGSVVLSSQWLALAREFAPPGRLRVIHNPMSLPAVDPDPGSREAWTLLFLGRIGESKGAWDLLNAVAALAQEHPKLRLWMGGDGELDEARARIRRLGLEDRVELLGWLRGADKEERLRRATVFALPSYNEGLPMGVLEAMAWSLPVLSTNVGGTRDAIPDDSFGFLIQPGDHDALCRALSRLLMDAELRNQLGSVARERIATTFSTPRIVEQVDQCYRELCGGAS